MVFLGVAWVNREEYPCYVVKVPGFQSEGEKQKCIALLSDGEVVQSWSELGLGTGSRLNSGECRERKE